MVLCIGATPAAQRVMAFEGLKLDEVNRARVTADGIAGKAINVAKVLKLLGEQPVAIGFRGGARGTEIQAQLHDRGIESDLIEVSLNTRQCITVIDERAGTQTELVEESSAVPEEKYAELLAIVRRRLGECKAVVMSGTLTPGGPAVFYRDCIELARTAGILTVLDAKGAALEHALSSMPGVVKPNRSELSATTGQNISDDRTCMAAMKSLHHRGAGQVIVTAGKDPTLAFDGRSFFRSIAPPVKAVNPIGSGDSFTAALTWQLLKGNDLREACRWGTAAGTANALTLMPAEFERGDLDRLVVQVKVEPISE